MKTIIKYDLHPLLNRIEMPAFSEILGVLATGIRSHLYVLGDPDRAKVIRRFAVLKTGHEIPDGPKIKHVASFVNDGEYVTALHVFEVEGSCKPEDFC